MHILCYGKVRYNYFPVIKMRVCFYEFIENGENTFMDNFKVNAELSDKNDYKKVYQRFAKQLSDWYCNGKTPDLASEDTRFALKLQKEKLHSLGLDMQIEFKKPTVKEDGVALISYGDHVFENSIVGGFKRITTNISNSGQKIYCRDCDGGLSVVMQNPKKGNVPPPDTAMCCPHCGAPSTLGKLESGCEFCDTKFLMDELYPKVMHVFVKDDSVELYDTKLLKKLIVIISLCFVLLLGVSEFVKLKLGMSRWPEGTFERVFMMGEFILAAVMLGAIIGGSSWFIYNVVCSISMMGKQLRGASKTGKSLVFCHKMNNLDPTFSTEYFRDKSMSLLKLMIYSQNPQELTICQCKKPVPEKFREIIDITYHNSGVNKYSIRDGVCDVSLTFYTDSLHYHNGQILRKSDKIRMSMRKVIKKPTDLGFSVTAVSCPSCGGSFDAEKVRKCPFCGNDYPLEENEWVVTDIGI